MFIEYPNNQYHEGIELDNYNGVYSIVSANKGQDGTVYKKWGYPQGRGKGAGPIEKSLPWKVALGGTKQQAVDMLKSLLSAIDGGSPPQQNTAPAHPPDNVPF